MINLTDDHRNNLDNEKQRLIDAISNSQSDSLKSYKDFSFLVEHFVRFPKVFKTILKNEFELKSNSAWTIWAGWKTENDWGQARDGDRRSAANWLRAAADLRITHIERMLKSPSKGKKYPVQGGDPILMPVQLERGPGGQDFR